MPYEFIGFGAMDVTKPYKFIGDLTTGPGTLPNPAEGPRDRAPRAQSIDMRRSDRQAQVGHQFGHAQRMQ